MPPRNKLFVSIFYNIESTVPTIISCKKNILGKRKRGYQVHESHKSQDKDSRANVKFEKGIWFLQKWYLPTPLLKC